MPKFRALSVPKARTAQRQGAPWAWALAGLLGGGLCAALVFAPATWLVQGVNRISQGRLLLSDGAGTVWNGSAQLAFTGGAGSREAVRLPGRLHWSAALGWGRLHMGWRANCCMDVAVQMSLAPHSALTFWNGWNLQVQALQSVWPAALLAGLGTPWNTVQAQGNLAISSPGFSVAATLERVVFSGDVVLEARNLQSRLSTLHPLGTYRLHLRGGEQPQLNLSTLKGDLHLSGQGHWNAGRLRFEGEARAEPARAPELSNLLNLLGRRDGVRSIITLG